MHYIENEISNEKDGKNKKTVQIIINLFGIISLILAVILKENSLPLYILSYLLIGYEIIFNAIKHLFKKDMFDENFLMFIATIGAFCIGEYLEAVAVILLYKIGEYLQDKAVENSKKKLENVLDIRQKYANLKIENTTKKVDPKEVNIGDFIVIKTGEKIPLDGVIVDGESLIDVSAITGESIPMKIANGDEVLSGAINIGGVITVEVSAEYENSTISKIIEMIQNAAKNKSKTEKFITRFSKIYTPIVMFIAVIIAVFLPLLFNIELTDAISRSLIFLVVSCPCALVISVPLGFFMGIGASSKSGILVKGSNYLDILSDIETVVFDKTGTLTKGIFKVTNIVTNGEISKEGVLENIALAEYLSNHYIAKSILNSYAKEIDKSRITEHKEIAGYGIKAVIDNKKVLVGNYKLFEIESVKLDKEEIFGTVIYLAIENKYMGYIVLSDELKEDALETILKLKEMNIQNIVMLTGDSKKVADDISSKIGITKVYSELLPKDKSDILDDIIAKQKGAVAYIGDGINDGPAIAKADIGIAMGKGSDIAIETSDVVLMTDELSKIVKCINISKKTKAIVIQNIVFAILIKIVFLVLSGFGITTMWEAIFADVGVSLIAILNCLRIFYLKRSL